MNDRFKFRVWVKTANSYISEKDEADIVKLEEDGKIVVGLYNGDLEDMMYLKEEDLIIEQCTGLKDKNGRLIYEGDIISVANGSINGNVCISRWEVIWKEKEGRYSVPSWVADKPDFSHYVKVLGNIHENPELLEDK